MFQECGPLELAKIGQIVYYPIFWAKIVVEAKIEEIQTYLYNKNNKKTILEYLYADGSKSLQWQFISEKDVITEEMLVDYEVASQFLWIDEPVGHGIQLGIDCFSTLNEALNSLPCSNKKHLKRRLKKVRSTRKKFIISTWDDKHPGFEFFSSKRIYVKRK